ncbi:Cytochrome c oxidase assembly protein cox19, partial [Perkinsus olseni]
PLMPKRRPPDKGSFPLDHFNQCKQIHDKYLKCLRKHKNDNRSCRFLAKEYLQCRMDHGLMAPEPMERLGFTPEDDRAHKPRDVRADTVREDKGWLAGRELLEARGWVRPRMFGGGVWGGNKLDNRNKSLVAFSILDGPFGRAGYGRVPSFVSSMMIRRFFCSPAATNAYEKSVSCFAGNAHSLVASVEIVHRSLLGN